MNLMGDKSNELYSMPNINIPLSKNENLKDKNIANNNNANSNLTNINSQEANNYLGKYYQKPYNNGMPLSTGHTPMSHTPKKQSNSDYDDQVKYYGNLYGEVASDQNELYNKSYNTDKNNENQTSDGNYPMRVSSDILTSQMHRKAKLVTQQTYINSKVETASLDNMNMTKFTQYNDQSNQLQNNMGYQNYYQDSMNTISTPEFSVTNQQYQMNNSQQINYQQMNHSNQDFIANLADIKANTVPNLPAELDIIPENSNLPYKLPDSDHISSTLSSVFKTKKLLEKLRLPFGVIYNPLKQIKNIPMISPKEVIRCLKCYAYINPFTNWVEPLTFVCNFCNRRRTITSEYLTDLSDLSPNSVNLASYIQSSIVQISMKNCTYDILAPSSFAKYPPKTPRHVVLLDMSNKCIETGYLEILFTSIYDKILNLCPNNSCSIAFIGYNKFIHFFSFKTIQSNQDIRVIHNIISDIDDLYEPYDNELFMFPVKNMENFKKFLTILPEAIRSKAIQNNQGIKNSECCMGNSLTFAINILKKSGGRIIFINGTKSTIGNGVMEPPSLHFKNNKSENINNQESLIGFPIINDNFFKSTSVTAGKYSICIDLFYFGFEKYSNLINLIPIINHCGGLFKYFGLFEKSKQSQFIYKFKVEIDNYLSSKYTIDNSVVMRLSRGMEIESYYGNFKLESSGKLFLPYINEETIISYKLDIEDGPYIYNNNIYIQIAHFYTNLNCERIIRVTTLPIQIIPENNPILIYHSANQYAITAIIARCIQLYLYKSKLSDVKQASFNTCKDLIIQFYNLTNVKFDGKNLYMHKNLCNLISFMHSILNNVIIIYVIM